MACGWLHCLQAYRKGSYTAWQLARRLQLGNHQRRSRRVCDSGCFHVRDWNECTWSSIELEWLLPWARCSSYSLSAGPHHSEAAGPRLRTAQSIAEELPLQLEKHMLPTVATVSHCRQRRQAHEHFVSLLWWHQPQRCGFVCLAHRSLWLQRGRCDQIVAYKETVSSPVAPSRLCFGGIVDGGTTALWVAPGFPTWRGLALICLCAGSPETAECFDVKTMPKSMFVTFVVEAVAETSQPDLSETLSSTVNSVDSE